jgi:hypothetical protein
MRSSARRLGLQFGHPGPRVGVHLVAPRPRGGGDQGHGQHSAPGSSAAGVTADDAGPDAGWEGPVGAFRGHSSMTVEQAAKALEISDRRFHAPLVPDRGRTTPRIRRAGPDRRAGLRRLPGGHSSERNNNRPRGRWFRARPSRESDWREWNPVRRSDAGGTAEVPSNRASTGLKPVALQSVQPADQGLSRPVQAGHCPYRTNSWPPRVNPGGVNCSRPRGQPGTSKTRPQSPQWKW